MAKDQRGYGEMTGSVAGGGGLQYAATSELYYPTPITVVGGPGGPQGLTQEVAIVGAAAPLRGPYWPGGLSTPSGWKSAGRRAAGSAVIRFAVGEGTLDARQILREASRPRD
ncbi:MAG TPA: hypothetical protein VIL97_07660 [Thermoanaerobaculia bacterium]